MSPASQGARRYALVSYSLEVGVSQALCIRFVYSLCMGPGVWPSLRTATSHCSTPKYECVTSTPPAHMAAISDKIFCGKKCTELACNNLRAESQLLSLSRRAFRCRINSISTLMSHTGVFRLVAPMISSTVQSDQNQLQHNRESGRNSKSFVLP